MQSSSCYALSSAEASRCSDASLGAAAPRSSTGQPICMPVVGCQCQLCFLTLYTAQNLQSKERTGPSFHRVYLICLFLLFSHPQPVSSAALLFQGWPRSCAVPPSHHCLGARGCLGFPTLPTHKHLPRRSPQIQVLHLSKEHILHETTFLTSQSLCGD